MVFEPTICVRVGEDSAATVICQSRIRISYSIEKESLNNARLYNFIDSFNYRHCGVIPSSNNPSIQ
jgi:hypothetical protein